MPGRIRVGTSGWSYDHWTGVLYPEHLPVAERLRFYTTRYDTVEIDATFYRLPSEKAVRGWRDAAPPGFAFAVKGSRLITHFRKLDGVAEALGVFLDRVSLLGSALEVVLWQLPPQMPHDVGRIEHFLDTLPRDSVRHAMEFRDEWWLRDDVLDALRARNVAIVHVSSDAMPEDRTTTADFAYVRFHGTASYHGAYAAPALKPWAEFLVEQARLGRDCYAYFNNDAEGHAPRDAERLVAMLKKSGAARG